MPWENGVHWRALDPNARARHKTFGDALDAAFQDLITEHDPFFDALVDSWATNFPDFPQIRPGRYEDGYIYLYVRNAPTSFAMRPKLSAIKKRLANLPNAPKKINLRLEIHS